MDIKATPCPVKVKLIAMESHTERVPGAVEKRTLCVLILAILAIQLLEAVVLYISSLTKVFCIFLVVYLSLGPGIYEYLKHSGEAHMSAPRR